MRQVTSESSTIRSRIPLRFIADVVALVTAMISLTVAVLAVTSRDQAEDRARSLSEELSVVEGQLADLNQERERLLSELDERDAETEPDEADAIDAENAASSGGTYARLDDAVATDSCEQHWGSDPLQLGGEQYFDGFTCDVSVGYVDLASGYVDFLVPAGTQQVSGIAGIDERSADETIVVRFAISRVGGESSPLFTTTLSYGHTGEPFEVELDEVARLRFEVTVVSSEHCCYKYWAAAGWGEVLFE
jgi:hypothetical protein